MRALAVAVTLAASTALAGWRSATIAGTPRDVTIPDAGLLVVATNGGGGMALFATPSDGGATVSVQSAAGNYVSASMRGPCLMGFTGAFAPAGNLIFDNVCAGNYALNITGGRVRVNAGGAAYASTANGVGLLAVQRLDPAAATSPLANWQGLVTGGATASTFYPLATLGLDGGDWAATETQPAGVPTLTFYKAGTQAGTAAVGAIRDLALFDRNGTPGAIVVNDVMQVVEVDDLAVASSATTLALPAQVYTSVGYTEKNASAYGRGFGMITSGTQVWSPVPNPAAPGRVWVQRTATGNTPTALTRVTCFDPSWCAGIAGVGAGNVLAYSNDNAPASDLKPLSVAAGATTTYVLDAGDLDGDPIWVTWVDGGFVWDGGSPFSVSVAGPPVTCGAPGNLPPLVAVLSDGYAPHDRQISILVMATAGVAMPVPLIANPTSLNQTAGSGVTDTVTVTTTPDSGCLVPALTWSIASDAGFVVVGGAGGTVQVTAPAKFCSATPQAFALTGSGSPDASVTIPVTLNPWGAPNPPAFVTGTQLAGTSAMYPPIAASPHACFTTPGFPGTDLVWAGIDAGNNPTITVVGGPTALTVTSSDACVGGSVTAQARRSVIGTAPAQVSATAGAIDVTVLPSWQPITAATPFDAGFFYDAPASELRGDFSIGTNCLADRDLRAVVLVDQVGKPSLFKMGLAVPGPWSVPIPGGCSGGNFTARATLIDDAGTTYGPQPVFAFTTMRLPAHVPPLVESEAPVSCAQGARGTLNLALDPADCATQKFAWAGDALVAFDGGPQAAFAAPANDLQGQAGRTLDFTVTAVVGAGNTDTQVRRVRLVPDRFVEVSHRSDVPVAREEESLGVEVTLTNPTACAVSGVVLREALGGLKPVAGSVHVEGVAAESTIAAGVLEVPNLAIPARGSTRVRYLARVPLLSAARPLGTVTFAGTDVTVQTGLPAPGAGCGCTSAPVGALAFAAIALALLRSRRRTR